MAEQAVTKDAEIAHLQTLIAEKDAQIAQFNLEEDKDQDGKPQTIWPEYRYSTSNTTTRLHPGPLFSTVVMVENKIPPQILNRIPFRNIVKNKLAPSKKEDDDDATCSPYPSCLCSEVTRIFLGDKLRKGFFIHTERMWTSRKCTCFENRWP